MKLRRWASTATAVAVFLGLSSLTGAASASAEETAATGYVALGDSYSSGVGAGDYEGGDCKRSANAYPKLWNAANSPSSFDFTACSGARTDDVLAGQLGPLNSSTGLVSISVGGNDAGFADAMTTCVTQGESACLARIQQARDYINSTLPGKLDGVYNAITEKAPSAKVVVLGYPHIYKLGGDCVVGISEKSREAINAASDDLNDVTAKRAADHGFSFGDVRPTFTGHEICSGDEWLHSVTFPVDESYHPTAAGQSGGYLPVLEGLA
ncbi:SGNH/GDSL hydrolase family protein [Streptomyces smyrnaeus]|uniref:SGNH/GDSL hydrolase family protein n=1 Tax=Streptomyces TaxID=1883 RepID=UPI000C195721|nr:MULTISPECIES: SGNH/GDSL hydrolase family protein [unclassified Streptomyces]MBQ0868539.1 SGNH/GDSL hydrolase family protein [Streptomyces sp. RK75]MBQ1120927.1 SGNH/GDSL hydrolase family protein [Streptomyces sp. B15]MBQ1156989.1 SGNH/GDSL hydrolase family protein [Streptomyces sp. A73]